MKSLLFVSLVAIAPDDLSGELRRIEAVSRLRNARANITGALICTGSHFAGMLEGADEALEAVMQRIRRDDRHEKVIVVEERPITLREFTGWKLAYSGCSTFARMLVAPLFSEPQQEHVHRLQFFLLEMAR